MGSIQPLHGCTWPPGHGSRQGCWGTSTSPFIYLFIYLSSCTSYSCGRAEAFRAALPQQAWCFGSQHDPLRMGGCEEGRHKGCGPQPRVTTEMGENSVVRVSQPGVDGERATGLMVWQSWSRPRFSLAAQSLKEKRKKKGLSKKVGV